MNIHRRLVTVGVGAVVAVAAVVPLGPAPASADPAGLVTVGFTTAANSSDKTYSKACPPGTVVTGGAGYLTANPAAQGWVGLDQLEPNADGSGFTATLREVDGYAGNWSLTVRAQCAAPLPGWQRVSATSAAATTSATATTASCPAGKSVIGAGAKVNNGQGEVVLDDVIPSANLKTVTAKAYRVPGSAHSGWTLTAYAICANTPAGLQLVSWDTGPLTSTAHQSLNWHCDESTSPKGTFGGGFAIDSGLGNVLPSTLNIYSSDDMSAAADEFHAGYAGNWNLTLYLICGS
ncbi:hypothetical protein AB0J72_49205 [Dactylosporangium sp. NPDC049742]|uniref:hypothetical protein n=1 Tax=Dactylosporangium sp. NPDC049742 TaxID=3154737 RepID=UPI003441D459